MRKGPGSVYDKLSGTYPRLFVTQIQPSHGSDRKIFEVMTST